MEKLALGAKKLGLSLTPQQLKQFQIYYQELVEWNKRINLTTITGYEEVQIRHFLDSLTVTLAWKPADNAGARVIDVGAGNGVPGLPLKIAFPGLNLVLLDSTAKKANFLKHIVQKLGLENVEIVIGRAEEVAHQEQYREKFDIALSRAVAVLPALAELTLPFCKIGGRLIAQKKGDIEKEIKEARKAIALMGGSLREVKGVDLAEFTDERYLVIIDKVTPTPDQYPRRPGIPVKRPIL